MGAAFPQRAPHHRLWLLSLDWWTRFWGAMEPCGEGNCAGGGRLGGEGARRRGEGELAGGSGGVGRGRFCPWGSVGS